MVKTHATKMYINGLEATRPKTIDCFKMCGSSPKYINIKLTLVCKNKISQALGFTHCVKNNKLYRRNK